MSSYLLPIETSARELDHRLLMAVLLSGEGREIIVGDQQTVRNLSYLIRSGVFYGKHLFGKPRFSDQTYYKRLKKRGFHVAHLSEEGAVFPGDEEVWNMLLKESARPSVLDKNDRMFLWGEYQKDFYQGYENAEVPMLVTGCPRFDLYRKKYRPYWDVEISALQSKYGDFVLVNSAFSYANNGEGGVDFIFKKTLSYDASNKEHTQYRFQRWADQMHVMSDLVVAVKDLAEAYPEKNFVFRPHPSEDTDYYNSIFQGFENVIVKYEGTVAPWILACSSLLQNGCTTAIEAVLADTPVFNFTKNNTKNSEVYLSSACGRAVESVEQIISVMNDPIALKASSALPSDRLSKELLYNYHTSDSANLIANELRKMMTSAPGGERSAVRIVNLISYLQPVYYLVKNLTLLLTGKKEKIKDHKKRFDAFDSETINQKVLRLNQLLGKSAVVTHLSKYLLVVK